MTTHSYINEQEVRNQTKDIILNTYKDISVKQLVDDIQKVYPSSKSVQSTVLKAVCTEIANMVKTGLLEVVSLEDGIYRLKGW